MLYLSSINLRGRINSLEYEYFKEEFPKIEQIWIYVCITVSKIIWKASFGTTNITYLILKIYRFMSLRDQQLKYN